MPLGAVLLTLNTVFLVFGGFIYSGGFLGIEGYGYGWDKTRWGLLVLLLALALYVFRHVVQDKQPIRWREEVPATPEEELAHRELATASTAPDAASEPFLPGPARQSARRSQRGRSAIAAR